MLKTIVFHLWRFKNKWIFYGYNERLIHLQPDWSKFHTLNFCDFCKLIYCVSIFVTYTQNLYCENLFYITLRTLTEQEWVFTRLIKFSSDWIKFKRIISYLIDLLITWLIFLDPNWWQIEIFEKCLIGQNCTKSEPFKLEYIFLLHIIPPNFGQSHISKFNILFLSPRFSCNLSQL